MLVSRYPARASLYVALRSVSNCLVSKQPLGERAAAKGRNKQIFRRTERMSAMDADDEPYFDPNEWVEPGELLTVPQVTLDYPTYTDPETKIIYKTQKVTFPLEYYWVEAPTVCDFFYRVQDYIPRQPYYFLTKKVVHLYPPIGSANVRLEHDVYRRVVFVPMRREYHERPEFIEDIMTRGPIAHGSHAMQWDFVGLWPLPSKIRAEMDKDRTRAAAYRLTGYLPSLWAFEYDDRSKRYYFVDKARGRTTWEPPALEPATDWEITYDYPGLPFDEVWTNKEKIRGHEAGTCRIGIRPQPIDKLVKTALPQGWTMRRFLDQVVFTDHLSKIRQTQHPRLMRGNPLAPGVLIEAVEGRLKAFRFMCCFNPFESVNYMLVSREHLFEDSFKALMSDHHPHQLRRRLKIFYRGEEGLDDGGLQRQWFVNLSNIFLNPKSGLFEESIRGYYIISQHSVNRPDQLKFYRFFGRFIAMALLKDYNISPGLSRLILKQLMGRLLVVEDLRENMTVGVHRAIDDIRGSTNIELEQLDLRFEQTTKFNTIFELVEGGSERQLTTANREEYIALYIDYSVNRGKGTMSAIRQGFAEVIPTEWLSLFDETELERVLGGELGDIDVEEWKEYTMHPSNMNETQQNTWDLFWEALGTMNQYQLRGVLKFATGSDRVPFGGFVNLRNTTGQLFKIKLPGGDPERLPQASTCFLELTLFAYQSRADLVERLMYAVDGAGEGFHQE